MQLVIDFDLRDSLGLSNHELIALSYFKQLATSEWQPFDAKQLAHLLQLTIKRVRHVLKQLAEKKIIEIEGIKRVRFLHEFWEKISQPKKSKPKKREKISQNAPKMGKNFPKQGKNFPNAGVNREKISQNGKKFPKFSVSKIRQIGKKAREKMPTPYYILTTKVVNSTYSNRQLECVYSAHPQKIFDGENENQKIEEVEVRNENQNPQAPPAPATAESILARMKAPEGFDPVAHIIAQLSAASTQVKEAWQARMGEPATVQMFEDFANWYIRKTYADDDEATMLWKVSRLGTSFLCSAFATAWVKNWKKFSGQAPHSKNSYEFAYQKIFGAK